MKIDEKKLNGFTENIYEASELEAENNLNFIKYYGYVFDSCLTTQDKEILENRQKNTLNFSTLRPFVLHGLKAIKDSMPTTTVIAVDKSQFADHPDIPTEVVADQVTEKLQEIYEFSHMDEETYRVASDQFIGGKGIFKIRTDYVNKYNFDQTFYIERIEDPTTIFLDPADKTLTGKDAQWCAQKTSMGKEKFQRLFPTVDWKTISQIKPSTTFKTEGSFSWVETATNSYKKGELIVNVVDYYYYEHTSEKLYELPTGEIVSEKPVDIEFSTREIKNRRVWRVRYCGPTVLKSPEATVFHDLPFVFVPAETYIDSNGKRRLVPYAKHGFDAMRAKNFTLNYYMSEVLNRPRHTYRLPESMMTDNLGTALRDPSQGNLQVYKGTEQNLIGETQSTGEIQDVIAPPLPQELLQAAEELDKNLPAIFGTQFPSLNDLNNVSGKALYNLAQYMSASTEVLMQNLLSGLVQVSHIIKEAMPEILREEMINFLDTQTQEHQQIMFDYLFTPSKYRIVGHRGVATQLQKEANFENLIGLSKTVPTFAQFLQSPEVMEQMLEMLNLQNEPKWLKLWTQYQQQQRQMAAENMGQQEAKQMAELERMKAQAAMTSANAKLMDAKTRASALPAEMHRADEAQVLEEAKLVENARRTNLHTVLETNKLDQKHVNDLLTQVEKFNDV